MRKQQTTKIEGIKIVNRRFCERWRMRLENSQKNSVESKFNTSKIIYLRHCVVRGSRSFSFRSFNRQKERWKGRKRKINGENWISQCHWFHFTLREVKSSFFIFLFSSFHQFSKRKNLYKIHSMKGNFFVIAWIILCVWEAQKKMMMKNFPTVMSINIFFFTFTLFFFDNEKSFQKVDNRQHTFSLQHKNFEH